jgi:hypothetical protein
VVSKEDFAMWKNDATTKAVFEEVESLIKNIQTYVMNGEYVHSHEDQTLQIGKCMGLRLLMEITHEDIE